MSHVVTVDFRVKDKALFVKMLKKHGWTVLDEEKVVARTEGSWNPLTLGRNGTIKVDNDDRQYLEPVIQDYVTELTKKTLRKKGYSLIQQKDKDGQKVLVFARG